MRRALMISYLFPPMGGVGVLRTLKFTRYLPEYGWNPHVLTAYPPRAGLRDESLLKEIPPETPVTRSMALLPPRRMPWRVRELITRWLLMVDEQVGWLPFATRAGFRILSGNPVEVIYSTSAPYTAHLVARQLHRKTHIPWVADFRDPWVGNSNLRFPTQFHRKWVERLERQVVQDASHILVISPPMGEYFSTHIPGIPSSKITWLPNGFDAGDFISARHMERDKDRFYLTYTGSFYSRGRTARAILEAVQAVTLSGQIPRQRFRLQLIGNIGKSTQRWISELSLEDVVETPGYVSHSQSIASLLAADALLLIIGDAADSSAVYTGKIFEYLAAGKPILCLAQTGVAADLIQRAHAGVIASSEDTPQISQCLIELFRQWQYGELSIAPDQALIQTFERRRLTGELAGIFDTLAGKNA